MSDHEDPDATEDEEIQDSLEQLAESIKERRQANENNPTQPTADSHTPDPPDALDELLDEPAESPSTPDIQVDVSDVEELNGVQNVLVLGSLRGRVCDEMCASLLAVTEPANVLFVTLTHTTEDRLDVINQIETTPPERVAVIRVGSRHQAQEHSTISTTAGPSELSVSGVGDPSDLTRLGIAISRCRSQWPEDSRTTACIHSLTELLQYADQQRLFRFIHILKAKLDDANTNVHFHMNPSAHPPEILSVFRTLFDAVVEIDDNNTLTVTNTTN